MPNIKDRLEISASLLAVIDRRRRQTNDPNAASAIEKRIIDRELSELEEPRVERNGNLVRVRNPRSKDQ